MILKINGTSKYSLDTVKECLIENVSGIVIPKEKVPYLNTNLYGKETKQSYGWYNEYTLLNIKLHESVQGWVNLITIRDCNTSGNVYTTKTIVQTETPFIIVHDDVQYAVLFRFGDKAISKDGKILDLNTKAVTSNKWFRGQVETKETYYYYTINNKEHLVHRLILEAWVYNENPSVRFQVNHIDGNKLNNVLSNLEWVSPSENIRHLFQTGLSNQNIVARIRHRVTKEIKEFHSKSEMCRFLGIAEQSFINTPVGYLYGEYEIRVSTDTRDWYFINGDEPVVPKFANFMFRVYKNDVLVKTLFLRDELNIMFGYSKDQIVSKTVDLVNKQSKDYRIEMISLSKTGPYDVKNIKTNEVRRFDNVPQIASYIDYNESSIRVNINVDKLVKGVYAIKTADEEWKESYNEMAGTQPKEVTVKNIITGVVTVCPTQREAYELVGTTKKTLKKHMNTGRAFNNYLIICK